MNISSRPSNSNFAHHFVIHWLLSNGANKNQHQDSYQRETIYDEFVIFPKSVRQKSQKGELNTCIYVSKLWAAGIFVSFFLVTKKCEKEVFKKALFSNERQFEFCFSKMKNLHFWEENYLNYTKKTQFCMWQLLFS